MASILQFDPARRVCAPRGGAFKGPAKILFFTGVRYERQPAQSLIEQKTRRAKAHRQAVAADNYPDADA